MLCFISYTIITHSTVPLQDYNELKIYNDKAQQTIKDLKSCLEEARTERTQLVAEIRKLKDQGTNHKISAIVNGYIEKGLYEEAEKDHMAERSRPQVRSPVPFYQRSVSPVMPRAQTPVRAPSPVRVAETSYFPTSRSQTPTSYLYDNDDNHEIYPHRRTFSYMKKYGSHNDLSNSQVDLNDPEIQELLKPKATKGYELSNNDNQYVEEHSAKRKLMYSPYMDKNFKPKSQQNDYNPRVEVETPPVKHMAVQHHQMSSVEEEIDDKRFMWALDSAVKQTPAQLAQQKFLQELDGIGTDEHMSPRWRSPGKGILKNTKSAHNMSIKENLPERRSVGSRSYSPSVRVGSSYVATSTPRSYTPNTRTYTSPGPVNRNTSESHSMDRNRSQSPRGHGHGQRSYSPGCRAYSPSDGHHGNTVRDSGYSTPTPSQRYRVNNRPRTPTRQYE